MSNNASNESSNLLDDHIPSQPQSSSVSRLTTQLYSIKSQFNQLSTQKQFAFISLVAIGTSMLITGRSVRAIMKRMNTQATEYSETEMMKKTQVVNGMKTSNHILENKNAAQTTRKIDKLKFWDNKSLLCVRENIMNNHSQGVELKFNPALDAIGAFGIATILVIGTSTLTIKSLSNRWELDHFNDWIIFIQSGYLAKHLIPKNFSQSISQSIPDKLRTSNSNPPDSLDHSIQPQSSTFTSFDSQLQDLIHNFDQQWEVEKNRREIERIQWENQRRILGKKVWSD